MWVFECFLWQSSVDVECHVQNPENHKVKGKGRSSIKSFIIYELAENLTLDHPILQGNYTFPSR